MNNYQLSKRSRQHENDEGRLAQHPRWKHQRPRPNYQCNQPLNNSGPSYDRRWPNSRRGSFHPHQTPSPRPFYQAQHQQQFYTGHNNYSQFQGPSPMYNNQQQWNASYPPLNQLPWRETHQPSEPREAEYNPSDSSTSSSPSYTSTTKTDAFPGYFTTAISQTNSSPPNSSPSGSTEYEPVFSTSITTKNRSVPSQSKKNKVMEVLDVLDPKLIQVVRYLTTLQKEIQESCDGKAKEEVQVANEDKRQRGVKNKVCRTKCIRQLYQNKICSSCEKVFRDICAHTCLREENYSEWYPKKNIWINGRAACDKISY